MEDAAQHSFNRCMVLRFLVRVPLWHCNVSLSRYARILSVTVCIRLKMAPQWALDFATTAHTHPLISTNHSNPTVVLPKMTSTPTQLNAVEHFLIQRAQHDIEYTSVGFWFYILNRRFPLEEDWIVIPEQAPDESTGSRRRVDITIHMFNPEQWNMSSLLFVEVKVTGHETHDEWLAKKRDGRTVYEYRRKGVVYWCKRLG